MTTFERAEALASAAGQFPVLGEVETRDLLELVRLELGHEAILDDFQSYGRHLSRAMPPRRILHIVSGNTAHAALQSAVRGLLLGSHNLMKIPSGGLPEILQFRELLPEALRGRLELRGDLPEEWKASTDAWIVFGSDETVAHFRRIAPREVRFVAHPHRVSLGIVFDDPEMDSVSLVAKDVSLFNQRGCLSPQDVYVGGDAKGYAERLAVEMERYNEKDPRGEVSVYEAAQIADMRANYRFRGASDGRVGIWESEGSTAWTVIYEEDAWFAASCLNRLVFVKPLPEDLELALGPVRPWLAGIGIWPATPENARKLASLGASRISALGAMQDTPMTWHHEGKQSLAPLVRWVDFAP